MKITRDDDFGGAVLNCAVRYALGRASYMPKLLMNEIRPMLPDCSDKTLWCFDRDINNFLLTREVDEVYFQIYNRPSVFYEYEWKRFQDDVRAEINRREAENNE